MADSRGEVPGAPDNTIPRLERLVQARWLAAARARRMEVLGIPSSDSVAPFRAPSRRRASRTTGHRRSAVLAGGVTAGALVTALLVGARVDLSGTRAGADTTAMDEPPLVVTARETLPSGSAPEARDGDGTATSPPLGRQPTSAAAPRRFAWAPVANASGYHVEFFRGSSRVFAADASRPQITIPASWSHGGREARFEPGEYRWYVWPLVSGRRSSEAVVQAKLVVAPR